MSELNMQKPTDRMLLRKAVSEGWPITPEDMATFYRMLQWAAQEGVKKGDIREVNSCIRTLVYIVGQVQSDQQLAEKYERIDRGDLTDAVRHEGALKIIENIPEDAV